MEAPQRSADVEGYSRLMHGDEEATMAMKKRQWRHCLLIEP
jgi:hypothetical protein